LDIPEQDGSATTRRHRKEVINWQEIEQERLWEDRKKDWRLYVYRPVQNGNDARRRRRKKFRKKESNE
jgi:hypothetical protein